MRVPFYLQAKLETINGITINNFQQYNYLILFQWLKDLYPTISYNALFDLYCLHYKLPIASLNNTIKESILLKYKQLLPNYAPLAHKTIDYFLTQANEIALLANQQQEVPIGAVVVKDNKIIASGFNQTLSSGNIMHHAEIVALQQVSKIIGSHRLNDCDLYVTVEPCVMCSGAIIHSRIKRVIFGACEIKTGAIISQYQLFSNETVNKHTQVIGPINHELYIRQLQHFFHHRRANNIWAIQQ
jgi:tRNA(Arg) A34 adenosine deaminase TadA